jgi:hypothetical protein
MAERFSGPHARDAHREGLGDDYARDGEWSGAGRHDDYVREPVRAGAAAASGSPETASECYPPLTSVV